MLYFDHTENIIIIHPCYPQPLPWIIHESVLIPAKGLGAPALCRTYFLPVEHSHSPFALATPKHRNSLLAWADLQGQPMRCVAHYPLAWPRMDSHVGGACVATPAKGHLQILGWERMWFGYMMWTQLAPGERQSPRTAIVILLACTVNSPCTCNDTVVTFHQCELQVQNRSSSLKLQDHVICLLAPLYGMWINDAEMGHLTLTLEGAKTRP